MRAAEKPFSRVSGMVRIRTTCMPALVKTFVSDSSREDSCYDRQEATVTMVRYLGRICRACSDAVLLASRHGHTRARSAETPLYCRRLCCVGSPGRPWAWAGR